MQKRIGRVGTPDEEAEIAVSVRKPGTVPVAGCVYRDLFRLQECPVVIYGQVANLVVCPETDFIRSEIRIQ